MNLSEEEVVEAQIAANGYLSSSLDATVTGDPDESETTLVGVHRRGGPGPRTRRGLPRPGPTGRRTRRTQQRLILHLRFVEELTQAQIGARLGISQMHVSRLISRTVARLRSGMLTTG